MEVVQNRVMAWKWLEKQLSLVGDKVLRNSMMAELKKKALEEWGYFPNSGMLAKKEPVVLDDWEKEFVEDIKKHLEYEVDTRKGKREKTEKEARVRMLDFIRSGGRYSDLPEDLQNETIRDLYFDVLFEEMKFCEEFLEK